MLFRSMNPAIWPTDYDLPEGVVNPDVRTGRLKLTAQSRRGAATPSLAADNPIDPSGYMHSLGRVRPDYMFAEFRRLDYLLVYRNPSGYEVTAPLRIPGVLDVYSTDMIPVHGGELRKTRYFVDDVVDWSDVRVLLTYDTARGAGEMVRALGGRGSYERVYSPVHPAWEWSLNYPRQGGQAPSIRVNVGNVVLGTATAGGNILEPPLVGGAPANAGWATTPAAQTIGITTLGVNEATRMYTAERRGNHPLEALYMVRDLEITWPTLQSNQEGHGGRFFQDYVMEYDSMREEWFQNYLIPANAEVIVHYYDTEETKRMVTRPSGSGMELGLFEHIRQVPQLVGPDQYIYQNQFFVITHQNGERFDDPFNIFPNTMSVSKSLQVPVYILNEDSEITITASSGSTMEWPIRPPDAIGSWDKFLRSVDIEADWVTMNFNGDVVGEPVSRSIDPLDPRIRIGGTRDIPPRIIDNVIVPGTGEGVFRDNFWVQAEPDTTIQVSYVIGWPALPATPNTGARPASTPQSSRTGSGDIDFSKIDPDEL